MIFFFVLKVFDDFAVFEHFEEPLFMPNMELKVDLRSIAREVGDIVQIVVEDVKRSLERG